MPARRGKEWEHSWFSFQRSQGARKVTILFSDGLFGRGRDADFAAGFSGMRATSQRVPTRRMTTAQSGLSIPAMSNRLSQIATRTGDDGSTGLGDGSRMPKNDLRICAMGEVDELNSQLGVLLAEPLPADVRDLLVEIQHELFNLGGELSIPGYALIKELAVARLDDALTHYNASLPRLKEFILPAGTRSAALAHVARSVARRAERALVALGATEAVRPEPRQYLNRLSDLLFVLARIVNRANLDGLGGDDAYWSSERLAREGP